MGNKKVVEKYMAAFRVHDHEKILSTLTDDVEWEMPGYFHHHGKEAFDKEIENEAFTGKPVIHITRLVEEGSIVVAEGEVKAQMKNGVVLHAMFCDVFHFKKDKIAKLTTYMMQKEKQQ
jgi:uncharacterized protein